MAEQKVKVWRASKSASAGIQMNDEMVQIVGSNKSAIEVGQTSIGLVSNSVSFGMSSSEIRTGGLFLMGDEFSTMIPSTIVTLAPQRAPYPPLGFVMSMVPMIPVFVAALIASQIGNS